uniref:sperm surface protein Sp17 n=1 Tax=Ciona intestinalis TaxID=7719 RepID=UPI000180B7A5|nr:sperm surface protein Sp17 [Ciona intestinalis]|eukprot:XP_002126179.1 sperm surface protein Sp17 [Ciona intestinalis]
MNISILAAKLRVPNGFSTLLECFATEVMREQPLDIVTFASRYFNQLLTERESSDKSVIYPSGEIKERIDGDSYFGTAHKKYRRTDAEIFSQNKYEDAAIKIQTSYKQYKHERKVKQIKAKQSVAATKIQSRYRGYKTRKHYKIRLTDKQNLDVAATKIQSRYRGYAARKKVNTKVEYGKVEVEAASVIQSRYRKHRKQTDTKTNAAIKIQSVYRGYKVRNDRKKQ